MNIFFFFFIQPIFNLLIGIYSLVPGGDFGISLIIFTILVRLALFPLVKKQLHQTRAMKKLQPKLAKIKAETKGNKQLESARMMDLYKEHGVNPFRSILILLIQLPIFIALYQVIRIFTQHRDKVGSFTYDFLEHIQPIHQLIANPDQFNEKLFGVIDLTKPAVAGGAINFSILVIVIIAVILSSLYYLRLLMALWTSSINKNFFFKSNFFIYFILFFQIIVLIFIPFFCLNQDSNNIEMSLFLFSILNKNISTKKNI